VQERYYIRGCDLIKPFYDFPDLHLFSFRLFLFGIFFAQNLNTLPLDSWRSTLARRIIVKILAKKRCKDIVEKSLTALQ
jgi:hypothetical protein